MEVIDMRTRKEKVEAFKWNMKEKISRCLEWAEEHPRTTIAIIGFTSFVIKETVTCVTKTATAKATISEQRFKERSIYDRSIGGYVELRRKMTTAEIVEFDRRRDNGERTIQILDDMNLLR